jgi:hypothetical protein
LSFPHFVTIPALLFKVSVVSAPLKRQTNPGKLRLAMPVSQKFQPVSKLTPFSSKSITAAKK